MPPLVLQAGTRLGPYEVEGLAAAGGMGQVYRGRDTRMGRPVAIKTLAAGTLDDPKRRARFESELRALAALQHPRVCAVYDSGTCDGVPYLVLEWLEGETLAARLQRRRLTVIEAAEIGRQMAEVLAAAHAAGLVHRDVTPSNVLLTAHGVKLLDFGIAAAVTPPGPAEATVEEPAGTDAGATAGIVGTPAYMAPEQLDGGAPDPRSDIFALGAVLYEMAAGRRAFGGATRAEVTAAVLERDPLPLDLPPAGGGRAFERLVHACLAKRPGERWQDAHDVARHLGWIAADAEAERRAAPREGGAPARWGRRAAVAGSAAALLLLGVAAGWRWGSAHRPPAAAVPLEIALPASMRFAEQGTGGNVFALSPDGRQVVYAATGSGAPVALYRRALDADQAQRLTGTEGASAPFFAPDGRSVGFFAAGRLERIDLGSGLVSTVSQAAGVAGAWSPTGSIFFASSQMRQLARVPAAGGVPDILTLTGPGEEGRFESVSATPRGGHLVVGHVGARGTGVWLVPEAGGRAVALAPDRSKAAIAAPGHLLFVRDGALVAQELDLTTGRVTGTPTVLARGLGRAGEASFAAAGDTLAYIERGDLDGELAWVDRAGRVMQRYPQTGDLSNLALSRDGRQLVYSRTVGDDPPRVHHLDLASGRDAELPGAARVAVWSPVNDDLAVSDAEGIAVNGRAPGAPSRRLAPAGNVQAWTPDGRRVLFSRRSADGWDIWSVPADGGAPAPYLAGPYDEFGAQLSPDGRWLAYVSTESGDTEVYVEAYPGHGSRRRVSEGGGTQPAWRADGRELYFAGRGQLLAVRVSPGPSPRFDPPAALFQLLPASRRAHNHYVPAPDGQRFLVVRPRASGRHGISLILNWRSRLRH